MSIKLLSSMTDEKDYLQSPMNDFFSFYYVTQWAAVLNNYEFTGTQPNTPAKLSRFRSGLLGSDVGRNTVTLEILLKTLEPSEHGRFLGQCINF
jgi:hypothetical protein